MFVSSHLEQAQHLWFYYLKTKCPETGVRGVPQVILRKTLKKKKQWVRKSCQWCCRIRNITNTRNQGGEKDSSKGFWSSSLLVETQRDTKPSAWALSVSPHVSWVCVAHEALPLLVAIETIIQQDVENEKQMVAKVEMLSSLCVCSTILKTKKEIKFKTKSIIIWIENLGIWIS